MGHVKHPQPHTCFFAPVPDSALTPSGMAVCESLPGFGWGRLDRRYQVKLVSWLHHCLRIVCEICPWPGRVLMSSLREAAYSGLWPESMLRHHVSTPENPEAQ